MAAKKVRKMPETVKRNLAIARKEKKLRVQIGRARKTDKEIEIKVSKKTAQALSRMTNGDGVVDITEDQFLRGLNESVRVEVDVGGVQLNPDAGLEKSDNILDKAKEIIYGDREQAYGNPRFNLDSIAQLWSVYLSRKFPDKRMAFENATHLPLQAEDVAQLMILLKTARLIHNPTHQDSLVDQAGYAALQDRIQGL